MPWILYERIGQHVSAFDFLSSFLLCTWTLNWKANWKRKQCFNIPIIWMTSFLTSGSPPVSRIFLTPSLTNSLASLTISGAVNSFSFADNFTPSSGMQYWPWWSFTCQVLAVISIYFTIATIFINLSVKFEN